MKWSFGVSWLVAVALLAATNVSARVIMVGPNETVKTIAVAARQAQDDDIVEILSGEYNGDVAVWAQKRLTIRGRGQRPVLNAAGKSAEDKAIWVFRNGVFTVSNIEFRGARVSSQNGAGIRFERGKLTIANCVFSDNQIGILTANFSSSELIIEKSTFAEAPALDTALPHLLYAGKIALLRVSGSRFHGGKRGHLLKSRARVNDLRYNLLVDGKHGRASYELDFPNGGDVTLVGNVLGQSVFTENRTMVAYGSESKTWPVGRLRMVHNTFYSESVWPARFLHVFANNFDILPEIMTRNNLLSGAGSFMENEPGHHLGNFFVSRSELGDPTTFDFTLSARSDLRGKVSPIEPDSEGLQPQFEHWPPGQLATISAGAGWVPGARQATTIGNKP